MFLTDLSCPGSRIVKRVCLLLLVHLTALKSCGM